jgi:carbohydrate-binding DOMON domain-containing protein
VIWGAAVYGGGGDKAREKVLVAYYGTMLIITSHSETKHLTMDI